AWFEILYHHTGYNSLGEMNRYEKAADMFGLLNSDATDEQKLLTLNTLYNGVSYSNADIYNTIQQRDEHKEFETKIAAIKYYIESLYSSGVSIDFIQVADGTW